MDQKDRILDLVKQGVISMEEALDLLEASKDPVNDQPRAQATEIKEEFSSKVSEELEETIQSKQEVLKEKEERLTIVQQRLREIEIFSELDDLSEDMKSQEEQFKDEIEALEREIKEVKTDIEVMVKERDNKKVTESETNHQAGFDYKENFKRLFNDQDYSEAAKRFTQESKKLGTNLIGQMSDLVKNFNSKDINLSLQIPWLKTEHLQESLVFEEDFDQVLFKILNGSLDLVSSEGSQASLEADIRLHGNYDQVNLDTFMEYAQVEVVDHVLIIKVLSPRIAMDGRLLLPQKVYDQVRIELTNGDLSMEALNAKDQFLLSRNGSLTVKGGRGNQVSVENLNGDIQVHDSHFETIKVNQVNGKVRLASWIKDLKAEGNHTDILVTKNNADDGNISIKTLVGQIKLALPQSMHLLGQAKAQQGRVLSRLSEQKVAEDCRQANLDRPGNQGDVKVDLDTLLGNIYLKDSLDQEKEG